MEKKNVFLPIKQVSTVAVVTIVFLFYFADYVVYYELTDGAFSKNWLT